MDDDIVDFSGYDYVCVDPYSKDPDKVALNSEGARFVLQRQKRKKSYQAIYDVDWSEVISYEVCEANYGKNDKSWPIDEELVEKMEIIGPAGMLFLFLMQDDDNITFQVWSYFPLEDVRKVREMLEEFIGRPHLPRLAHHGNAAAVRHILDNCTIRERIPTTWHDWIKTGPLLGKPREKRWREKGPDYVYCNEGLAIDFYGAGEQLEQMSTFWPWRMIVNVIPEEYEILYQWYDAAYVFRQQVWEKEDRSKFLDAAKNALSEYRSNDDIEELLSIRPWSFPSYDHSTWEKLEPFSCKASRNRFPPILDFEEE